MSAIFNGSAFVSVNVPGRWRQNAFITSEQTADDDQIGLSSTREQKYLTAFCLTGLKDLIPGGQSERIIAIAVTALVIGVGKALQNGRVTAFEIIAGEWKFA